MLKTSLVRVPTEVFSTSGQFASAGVPVIFVTAQDKQHEVEELDEMESILPLPSSKYRYSKWSELDDTEIAANMLRCPRIRKAPQGFKVDTLELLEEQEENQYVSKKRSGRTWFGKSKKKIYTSKLENWETCEFVNLSYQNLAHPYQMKEFLKVLRRLIRAEMVELIENNLTDLSTLYLPKCRYLFLQRNHMTNLKKLPRFGNIEHISLQQNNITSLDGLQVLRLTSIKSLVLRDNPVALKRGYRKEVFNVLPNLVLLDDLPRGSEIEEIDPDKPQKVCCIT